MTRKEKVRKRKERKGRRISLSEIKGVTMVHKVPSTMITSRSLRQKREK
jgi:hypothetical protein